MKPSIYYWVLKSVLAAAYSLFSWKILLNKAIILEGILVPFKTDFSLFIGKIRPLTQFKLIYAMGCYIFVIALAESRQAAVKL